MPMSPQTQNENEAAPELARELSAMLASQAAALEVVGHALGPIASGAALMASAVKSGAVLHYAAAGSSGLMALADASELPGTFGLRQNQIAVHMAGGVPVNGVMPGNTEDDTEGGRRDAASVQAGDLAIVVSASGTTPYAIAFSEAAKTQGARVISVANVAESALLALADVPIVLPTAPEFIEGSTRLGAGTSQKVALNMMSSLMGMLLGHVHDRMMVNLHPDNMKLQKRATDIVCRISGVSEAVARQALEQTGYNTKAAALVACGISHPEAACLLEKHGGVLSACLRDKAMPQGLHHRK